MPPSSPASKFSRNSAGMVLLPVLAALLPLSLGSPAHAGVFTDSAGRRVMLPAHVTRVLPADRNAEVLLEVLAPQKLAGLGEVPWRRALPNAAREPVIEWQRPGDPAVIGETARRLHADLIIDGGPVTTERAAQADLVQRASGTPYILVDDSFSRMPQMMRSLGEVLGASARAGELATYAEHAIAGLRGRLLIVPPEQRPRVYFALGRNGQTAALPGSPAAAAIEEAGTINVARPLGRGTEVPVSPAQLRAWNPDVIIAESRDFYTRLRRDPAWREVAAVRRGRVYLEPISPFGWIEDPSGVNRVIGLHWLSVLLYPGSTEEELRTTVCDFYDKFYRMKLTNAAIESLVRPAGIPAPEVLQPVGEAMANLGAPPATAAPTPPAAPSHRRRGPQGPLSPSLNGLPEVPPTATAPLPSAPETMPSAPGTAGSVLGVPGMPSTAPNAACTVPTGPTPQPLAGLPGPGLAAPGALGLPEAGAAGPNANPAFEVPPGLRGRRPVPGGSPLDLPAPGPAAPLPESGAPAPGTR